MLGLPPLTNCSPFLIPTICCCCCCWGGAATETGLELMTVCPLTSLALLELEMAACWSGFSGTGQSYKYQYDA